MKNHLRKTDLHLIGRGSSRSLLATTANKSTLSHEPWRQDPITGDAASSASTDLKPTQVIQQGCFRLSLKSHQSYVQDSCSKKTRTCLHSASYRSSTANWLQLCLGTYNKLLGWHSAGGGCHETSGSLVQSALD